MKIIKFHLLILLGFLTMLAMTAYGERKQETIEILQSENACLLEGRVIKVTDGDTVNVLDVDKKTHKIRLAGIDAPERGQAYGQAARKFLANQINQKIVCVEWHKKDKYRRLVGVIKYEDKDVNLSLVKAGYAWHYKKYQREQSPPNRVLYAQTEIQARSDAIGLWSEPSPINPSDWRKRGKKSKASKAIKKTIVAPEDFTCGAKRFCKQMTSCAEACFSLKQCGVSRLDGNNDGIPCSKLCHSVCEEPS